MNRTLTDTEQLFKIHYQCNIYDSGKSIARVSPLQFDVTRYDPSKPSAMIDRTPIINIEIPKDKYERFIINYGMYLDILSHIHDPVVRNEFNKLMMLIELKK